MASPDVVVVGGGAIGLSIAWRARGAGLGVTLLDPRPGEGASWAAAGMLAPVTEIHYGEEELLRLNLASSGMWPDFGAELDEASGRDCGYRVCGTLVVARDADDNAALSDLFEFQKGLGLEVERLRGREVRALEPSLAPSTRGGILVRGDHQVDNRALVTALLAACERTGVHLIRQTVDRLLVEDGRVAGVECRNEVVHCGAVVLAAGWASGAIGGLPPEARPRVRPVKGQLIHLRAQAGEGLFARNLRGLDVYLVARGDGRVVVGATVEERGEDLHVTAGGVHELLRAAYELVPGITEFDFVEATAGLRPGSPDNGPLLGPGAVEGLVVATGHFRNGILLTPVTAEAIAELLQTGRVPETIAGFSPQRFEGALHREAEGAL